MGFGIKSLLKLRNEIGQRYWIGWIDDLLQLEYVAVGVAPVGRAKCADCLRLSVKLDSCALQSLVFRGNVNDIEGDVGQTGVAGRPGRISGLSLRA